MQSPADSNGPTREAVRAALLEYFQTPGKYQIGQRQPRLLFAGLREVLHIAVGREADAGAEPAKVREAARFFIRTALLYPGADHYALLGLDRSADAAVIKDHYRLMMRLLHPDFAGPDSGAWPDDAAVRMNRAYEVLSSPVLRRDFDEGVAPVHAPPVVQKMHAPRTATVPHRSAGDIARSRLKSLVIGCAVAGVALVIVGIVSSGTDGGHLVQRAHVPEEPLKIAIREKAPDLPAVQPAPAAPAIVVPREPAAPRPVAEVRPPEPAPARTITVAAAPTPMPQSVPEPVRFAPPAPIPAPAPVQAAVTVAPVVLAAPPPPPPPPVQQVVAVAHPVLRPGPTLMEAQPLLSQLLQLMESGRGDRILNLLDAEAREKPSAQALSRQYDLLVNGAQPVRLSHVEFKAEPGDGRLLVVCHLRLQAGEQTIGSMGQKLVVRAEFASRAGTVVITGLSGGPAN